MYRALVEKFKPAIGSLFKAAADLAVILDHPKTQESPSRPRAFNPLCAIFVQKGLEPPPREERFRDEPAPNYAELPLPQPIDQIGPGAVVRVLIVDDDEFDYIKSALALVGVPNLEVQFLHCDEERVDLEQFAGEVLACEPHIVLMDEFMGKNWGHLLVPVIKAKGGQQPIFIANSGTKSTDLEKAGCMGSFAKGKQPQSMLEAIRELA